MQAANYCYYEGQFRKAVDLYNKVLQENANYVGALLGIGFSLNSMGKFKEAFSYIKKVLDIDSNNEYALACMGSILSNMHQHQKAMDYFEKVLKINRLNISALYHYAYTLLVLGRFADARKYIERALPLIPEREQPDYANALYVRGEILDSLGDKDEALVSFDKSLVSDPHPRRPFSIIYRGVASAKLRRFKDAHRYIEEYYRLEPDNIVQITHARAIIYNLEEKVDLSLNMLEEVVKMDPQLKPLIRRDKTFENLKDNPKFIKIVT